MRARASLLTVLFAATPALAQRVEERQGNIFFIANDGTAHQLTDSGKDREPSLSPDGRRVFFIHATGESSLEGPFGSVEGTELWEAAAFGESRPGPIYQGTVLFHRGDGKTYELGGFLAPRLSPDVRYVYFLAEFGAVTGALCRLDLRNKQASFVSAALQYAIVPRGHWKGYLVANVRTYERDPTDGVQYPHYPFFLLTPDGKKVKRVGYENDTIEHVVSKLLAADHSR